jgi:uncharacterized protein YjbJ (UPF0337 family)
MTGCRRGRKVLDDDRVARAARKVRGSVKEAIGKINGDVALEAEGAAEKTAGEARATADRDAEGEPRAPVGKKTSGK